MGNVGALYVRQGRYRQAEAILRETFELDRRVRGERHPATLIDQYNLACAMARDGRRREALSLLREIVEKGYDGASGTLADIADDADLESLRGDPEFGAIVAEVRRRSKPN